MLNGKKIIFVGNSYTYYGKCVLEKKPTVLEQAPRSNDQGYFYQLCKENGMQVQVTNWTFGAHTLADLFTPCAANKDCAGVMHADYLTDRNFDYVVLQEAGNARAEHLSEEEFLRRWEQILAFFKAGNPNAQFIFLVHQTAHRLQFGWLKALPRLAALGVKVIDWGGLVWAVINGAAVPGATLPFDKNSFIVCRSEKDGFHPNPLTGYLTALMTYCAITGQSPMGQPYSFCGNESLDPLYSFRDYMARHYTYGQCATNFPEVFASSQTMTALQKLADQYLSK